MPSPFSFNFQPQQQQGNNSLQQILSMRQQQGAQPMQSVQPQDMSQPQQAGQQKSQTPLDFMSLAGQLGYKPDPTKNPLEQQSAAIGHIVNTIGGFF